MFGRARPATGFSADLKTLMRLGSHTPQSLGDAILAPPGDAPGLPEKVAELRAGGRVVICELPGQTGDPVQMGCAYRLQKQAGSWAVVPL